MTKQEFIKKIEQEKPLAGSIYRIKTDALVDSPYVIGCYNDNGVWKIYATEERGGYYVIDETKDESEAYDILYEQVYVQKRMTDYIKEH